MCSPRCLDFINVWLKPTDVAGKRIIEVGSQNVNGSAREIIMPQGPAEYIGTDLAPGPGVDVVCPAENLLVWYEPLSFDGVVCTEMLEHCENWRLAIHVMKLLLREGGWIIITTRSKGYPLHNFPGDHWRFDGADMQAIFADFNIEMVMPDPFEPGVFIKAYKPIGFAETDLHRYHVHSMGAA